MSPSSQCIPTKLTSCLMSFYSTHPFASIPFPTYIGVIFDRTLCLSKHRFALKAKLYPHLKVLSLFHHEAFLGVPFCGTKLYFGPASLTLHPDDILFLALLRLSSWNAFTEQLVGHSPDAFGPPLSHFCLM